MKINKEIERLEFIKEQKMDEAIELLIHYFGFAHDNDTNIKKEIGSIAENIVDAAITVSS